MLNYQESVDFINNHKDHLRAVIVTSLSCRACETVINLFNESSIPFALLNADSADVVYKPGVYPQTHIFSKNNKCYTRYDVYDSAMLADWMEKINAWEESDETSTVF